MRAFEKVGGVVTELGTQQTFKVVTEGSASMNAADQAAQEEFLHKTARLYRAVSGALRTAQEVESRLKKTDSRGAARDSGGREATGGRGGWNRAAEPRDSASSKGRRGVGEEE